MSEEIKREKDTVSFQMVIPSDKIEEAMTAIFNREKQHFQLPGFRKGKVPRKLIEANFGQDIFFEDAVNELIPEIYEEKVEELDLDLASQPTINLTEPYEKGKDVVLDVSVDVMPEIELKDYSKIEIPKVEIEVTDEMIENEIQSQREQNKRATLIDDRPAKEGDNVVIDYTGFIDDEEFEGGSAEDHTLELGSGTFIPGFEEQLIGKETGEDVEVKVTFPEEYHAEELAGKEAVFDVHINQIQEIEYPEVDDEFIKDISEYDTVEEYKSNLKEKMQENFDERAKAEERQAVLLKAADFAEFEVPEAVLENAIDREINNFSANLQNYGLNFEQYIEMTGGDESKIREDFKESAYVNSKIQMVMEAIIEKEEIDATEEEVQEEVKRLAEQYFPENEEQQENFCKMYEGENAEVIKSELLFNKALDLLMENVEYVEMPEPKDVTDEEVEEEKEEEEE